MQAAKWKARFGQIPAPSRNRRPRNRKDGIVGFVDHEEDVVDENDDIMTTGFAPAY